MTGGTFPRDENSCAYEAIEITKADTLLDKNVRALYVGGAGDVKVTMTGGQVVTFVGVLAGTILPVSVSQVWSTGTTASSFVGLI